MAVTVKKIRKIRCETFLALFSSTGFLHFVPNILSRIVGRFMSYLCDLFFIFIFIFIMINYTISWMQTHLFLCLLDSVGPMKLPLPVCLSVRPSVCPSVRQFGVFFRNGSLFSSDLLHDCRQLEYWKIDRAFFSRKIHFCPNFDKKGLKRAHNSFFWIF